jgi:transposase
MISKEWPFLDVRPNSCSAISFDLLGNSSNWMTSVISMDSRRPKSNKNVGVIGNRYPYTLKFLKIGCQMYINFGYFEVCFTNTCRDYIL